MSAKDLHFEKMSLINWITRIQDTSIISKLREIQADEDVSEIEIPQADKELVLNRIKTTSEKDYIPFNTLDSLVNLG